MMSNPWMQLLQEVPSVSCLSFSSLKFFNLASKVEPIFWKITGIKFDWLFISDWTILIFYER